MKELTLTRTQDRSVIPGINECWGCRKLTGTTGIKIAHVGQVRFQPFDVSVFRRLLWLGSVTNGVETRKLKEGLQEKWFLTRARALVKIFTPNRGMEQSGSSSGS